MMSMKEYEVSECIGARVRKLSRLLDNRYRKIVQDYGISENQLNILFYLNEMRKVEQGDIGKFMALERSTTSRNLSILTKMGLIRKSDDYRPTVEITSDGSDVVKRILPKWNELMNELDAALGPEGQKGLKTLEKAIV